MARIDQLFHYMKGQGGSDLHLATGLEPRIREIAAETHAIGETFVCNEALETRSLASVTHSPVVWP